MSSNTSLGRGKKGSKFWIQTLVNIDNGMALSKAIQNIDSQISSITWQSPLSNKVNKLEDYKELKTYQIESIDKLMLDFWPGNGPWWDAVGIDENGAILLVEAKAHVKETITKCKAEDTRSIELIKKSMSETFHTLTKDPLATYDNNIWYEKYYQLGNRLTFLIKLQEKGINVKLVLLNIVNDITHISTTKSEWSNHYNTIWQEMLGQTNAPSNVIVVDFEV